MRTSSVCWHIRLPAVIAVAAWGCTAISAPAASQAVRGEVRRQDTGEPIARARIELVDGTGYVAATTTSDDVGVFILATREPGEWWLRVRRRGFSVASHGPMTLLAKDTVEVVVLLNEPEMFVLDTVVVETDAALEYLRDVGFYLREELGLGRRVGPEAVDKRRAQASYVADYVVLVPGVVIVERSEAGFGRVIGMKSCQRINYYVDDRHVARNGGPPRSEETPLELYRDRLEDWVDAQEVLAIELYTGSSKRPRQYRSCSVVVWTRYGAMVHANR